MAETQTPPLKKPPLDELTDAWLNRPLAAVLVMGAKHTPITPNQITWCSIVFGVMGGVFLANDIPYGAAYAALCILLLMVFDCADGQLARARGGGSRAGRILDGFADYVNSVALHVGVYFALAHTGLSTIESDSPRLAVLYLVLGGAASMAVNAIVYDGLKGKYKRTTATAPDETDTPEIVAAELKAAKGLEERALLWIYLQYCRLQGSKPKEQSDAQVTPEQGLRARGFYDLPIRMLSWIGPTTHQTAIGVAALLSLWFAHALEWYLWVAIVPANAFMLLMLLWYRGIDARFKRESEKVQSASA